MNDRTHLMSGAALLFVIGFSSTVYCEKPPVTQIDCNHRGTMTWSELWEAPVGSDYSVPTAVGKAIAELEKSFHSNRSGCTDGCTLTGLSVEDGKGHSRDLDGPPYDKTVWGFSIASNGLATAKLKLHNGDKITAHCTKCDHWQE